MPLVRRDLELLLCNADLGGSAFRFEKGKHVTDVRWKIPEVPQRRRGKLYFRLLALTKRPGYWAVIGEYSSVHGATATVSRLRSRSALRPDGDYEFTCRTNRKGRGELFARSIPPELNVR
jgi:hypothetical protein